MNGLKGTHPIDLEGERKITEQELNTIVGRSLDWSFKIPDDSRGKKPFDVFGIYHGKPIYIESKNLKRPEAFPWDRFEPHQISNLLRIQELMPNAISLFLVCVDYGRAKKRIYLFQDMVELKRRWDDPEEKSIKKKEWDKRTNYVLIEKGTIDFSKLEEMKELEHANIRV